MLQVFNIRAYMVYYDGRKCFKYFITLSLLEIYSIKMSKILTRNRVNENSSYEEKKNAMNFHFFFMNISLVYVAYMKHIACLYSNWYQEQLSNSNVTFSSIEMENICSSQPLIFQHLYLHLVIFCYLVSYFFC